MVQSRRDRRLHILLLSTVGVIFLWSVINCHDLFTWALESFPVVIAGAILIASYRRFRLTNLAYALICIHAMILLVGAHYTYARMPLFDWIRDAFELSRNHYDRVGHFAQGFVPAIIAREVLVRKSLLQKGGWLFFVAVCVCLAISAMYELLEWAVAAISADNAIAFLATQGDEWDTQKDMALCLVGAVAALLTLSRLHDRELDGIMPRSDGGD